MAGSFADLFSRDELRAAIDLWCDRQGGDIHTRLRDQVVRPAWDQINARNGLSLRPSDADYVTFMLEAALEAAEQRGPL